MYHFWHRAISGRGRGGAQTVQNNDMRRPSTVSLRRFLLLFFIISTIVRRTEASSRSAAVCSGVSNSCCSEEKEKEMLDRAQRIFKLQLQDKVIILRHMLHTNLNSFRTYFYNSLNTCRDNLDSLFKKTYGPFYENNSKDFDTFFNRLMAFSSPYSDASVKSITDQLFSHVFRIVFSLLNPLRTVSEIEWRCMEENMKEIQPFGDIPQKVATHLEKTMNTWRSFIASLDTAHQILDGFLNTTLSKECSINLARLTECSQCSSSKERVKPCGGFCLNILRGCLAEWADIDQQWDAVVGGILRLSYMLRGPQNLHGVLGPLPVQLSEAMMIFQERGSTVTNKVLAKCFPIETSFRVGRHKRSTWIRSIADQDVGHYRIARQLMTTFGDRLVTMRGWFRSLPESFCNEDELAARDGDRCWNGTTVGGYNRNVALNGMNQQNSNPEFKGDLFLNYRGTFVEQRLQMGMLSFRLSTVIYGRNYTNYELEGSSFSDDEDYEEGSGDLPIVVLDPMEPSSISPRQSLVQSTSSVSLVTLLVILLIRIF